VTNLLHWLAVFVGLVLMALAYFLKENEESRLQAFLKTTTERLAKTGHSVVASERRGFQVICDALLQVLDVMFGRRKVSLRAVWASLMLSVASIPFFVSLLCTATLLLRLLRPSIEPRFANVPFSNHAEAARMMGLFALQFFLLALLPAFYVHAKSTLSRWAWVTVAAVAGSRVLVVFLFLLWMAIWLCFRGNFRFFRMLVTPLLLGVLCDLAFLMLVRWALKTTSHSPSVYRLVGFIMAMTAGFVLVTVLPIQAFLSPAAQRSEALRELVLVIAGTDVFDMLFALGLVLLGVILLLHRAWWPLLDRLLVPVNRWGIPRAPLFGLGFILFFFGTYRYDYNSVTASVNNWAKAYAPTLTSVLTTDAGVPDARRVPPSPVAGSAPLPLVKAGSRDPTRNARFQVRRKGADPADGVCTFDAWLPCPGKRRWPLRRPSRDVVVTERDLGKGRASPGNVCNTGIGVRMGDSTGGGQIIGHHRCMLKVSV
jgi:hypothetical protein